MQFALLLNKQTFRPGLPLRLPIQNAGSHLVAVSVQIF